MKQTPKQPDIFDMDKASLEVDAAIKNVSTDEELAQRMQEQGGRLVYGAEQIPTRLQRMVDLLHRIVH